MRIVSVADCLRGAEVARARLLQWTGRALRTEADEAVVVCYDARLLRQSYGRRMLQGLPPYRLQRRQDGVLTDV